MTVNAVAMRRMALPVQRALRNDFVRHGALVFAATLLTNVFNYAFNATISRNIGVENYAALSALAGALMILSIPAGVLNLIVIKYAAEYHALQDSARLSRLAHVVLRWASVAAVAIFALGMALRYDIATFLRIPNDAAVTLTVAILAVSFVSPCMRGILQGQQDFARFSASIALEAFLKAALAISFVYAGFGIVGAMLGWWFGSCTALAYTARAVRRRSAPHAQATRLSLKGSDFIRTTIGVAAATAALTALSFMDVILVKHYFDPSVAGVYAAVNLTGKIVLFLVGFLPMIVLPKAVAAAKRGHSPIPLLLQAALGTVAMSGLTLIVFGAVPSTIIRVLAGNGFVGGAPYVFQYDLAMGLLAIVTLLVNYKIGLHRFDFLYGLVTVMLCEIAAIALYHQSLWDVIHILLCGNALAIIACSYRLGTANRTYEPRLPVENPIPAELT